MKMFLVFLVTFLAFCSAAPSPCCTENQWESGVSFFDQDKKIFVFGNMAYDYTNLRQYARTVTDVDGQRTFETDILLFANKTGYSILSANGKEQCRKFSIPTPMDQFCIPSNATYLNTFTIGGSLSVDNWRIDMKDETSFVGITSTGCIPVSATGAYSRYDLTEESYFNYVSGIANTTIFNPPSICSN